LREKLKPLADIAGDLTNSPKNESGVERVRKLEALEADNAALRAELERLSAPVSDSELAPYSASGTRGLMLIDSKGVTALLAARKEKP
jgi:hypothetical protein